MTRDEIIEVMAKAVAPREFIEPAPVPSRKKLTIQEQSRALVALLDAIPGLSDVIDGKALP